MQVAQEKVVKIDFTVKDDQGNVLDSSQSRGPLEYLHGQGNIIPGLERALSGKSPGDDFEVNLPPSEAYGDHNPALVQPVPRQQFPEGTTPEVGQQFQAQTSAGPRPVTVVEVNDDSVTIDANHPLAGKPLHFDGTVVDVRDARPEELQHGHPH